MGLARIRGQDRALGTLGLAMEQDRFHHAYRFEGPDGVGKELTASCLVKVLNCEAGRRLEIPARDGHEAVTMPDSCDACTSCRKIAAGNHPDVRLLSAPAGKATISIKQVRELHGFVLYPPSEGRVKTVIVTDAEKITEEAANAFLKMLEEPPPRTHFFLVTSRPHKLLPTIMSRSVPVRFSPLDDEDMRAVLDELLPGQEGLDQIVAMSGGSVASALAHVSEEWSETLERVMELDAAFAAGMHALVKVLDDMQPGRDETYRLLVFLEMWYRDVAYIGVTGDREGLMLRSLAGRLEERASTLGPDLASAMALRIPEHRALIESYVNPRMVLERLCMELSREEL